MKIAFNPTQTIRATGNTKASPSCSWAVVRPITSFYSTISQDNWQTSPWNPNNNINYTHAETSFDTEYPEHPSRDKQPFFHSIPGMPQCSVLHGQRNIDASRMGQYWIQFIKSTAEDKNVLVCTTDMFDDAFKADESERTPLIFTDSEHYMFADISQVNSRNYNEDHWDRLQWLLDRMKAKPRPSNHIKIYGSGYYRFGTGGPVDGVERFWRNILGGSASARFHRPDAGNGLNDYAKASLRAARLVEDHIKFWDITPQMDLLSNRQSNEAYLAVKPGEQYVLYFTNGDAVDLDLSHTTATFDLTWISISLGVITETKQPGGYRPIEKTIQGGTDITLSAPYKGGWIATLVKQ